MEATTLIVGALIAACGVLLALYVRSERARSAAERDAALARQQVEIAERRMADWEKTKAETIEAAKAAALSSTREMSSKLLEDHKRESEAAKKATEERIKATTKDLREHFEKVVAVVASLNDQVSESKGTVETVWRALSTPGGAGHFAEIGLENTLKSFGLEAGRDFITQYTIAGESLGRGLRPDAVVFLPGEAFLVIDSKASKFLLEIAEAEGTESEEDAYASLAKTMNQHLKTLAGKDYKSAVLESAREAGRGGGLDYVLTVMYLPNEGAVEKVKIADPAFAGKAAKSDIIVAGPNSLLALVAFACMKIDLGRQAENQRHIVDTSSALLDGVVVALGHVEHVGRGLKSAAEGFARLTGSINSRMLPRARRLAALGVRPSKTRDLPGNLPAYEVVVSHPDDVIEGESEEVVPAIALAEPADE